MLRTACIALLLLALAGCQGGGDDGTSSKAERTPPQLGACRALVPEDITQASNQTAPVDCGAKHTAETFAVGAFPESLADADDPDDRALGSYVYDRCQKRFQEFLGGDESLVLRSTMTWAWFRPTKDAWAGGAHWYRCDVVGGGEQSKSFVALPNERILLGVEHAGIAGAIIRGLPRETNGGWLSGIGHAAVAAGLPAEGDDLSIERCPRWPDDPGLRLGRFCDCRGLRFG